MYIEREMEGGVRGGGERDKETERERGERNKGEAVSPFLTLSQEFHIFTFSLCIF